MPNEIFRQLNRMVFSVTDVIQQRVHVSDTIRFPCVTSLFLFIRNGAGYLDLNGTPHRLETGRVLFFDPTQELNIEADEKHPLDMYAVLFAYLTESSRLNNQYLYEKEGAPFPIKGGIPIKSKSQILHLIEELDGSTKSMDESKKFRQRLLLERLFYIFVQDLYASSDREDALQAIKNTIEYVDRHYMTKLSLEDLSKKAGVSPSYYSRLFKMSTGVSLSDYVTHLRINRAKELLLMPNCRCKEVAQSLGYVDEFYFSKMFKKVLGVSPTDYAQKNKRV